MAEEETDHAAAAITRLPQQFRSKTDDPNNIEKLLTASCASIQDLETVCQQVLTQRSIDTAVGAQLDVIGVIVYQDRNGLDDETYRRYLRATIATHRSNGTVENLIRVADLVIFDDDALYTVEPQNYGTVRMRIENLAIDVGLAATVFTFLARTASTGVRVILEFGSGAPAGWFRYDVGPGYDVGLYGGRIDK